MERQAAQLGVRRDVDQELAAQQQRQLAEVELGDQHPRGSARSTSPVFGGQRVEVTQVRLRDLVAGVAGASNRGRDRAVRRPPAEHEQLGIAGRVVDLERRDARGDPVDLGLAQPDHRVVVRRVVGDVAGAVGLLDAADPVLEPGRARDRPRPGEGRPGRGSTAGTASPSSAAVANSTVQVGQVVDVRDQPGLAAVGEVGVGEQVDRRAVRRRDPHRFDRGVEAVGRRLRAR